MLLVVIQRSEHYDDEVSHIDNEGTYRESEIPNVSSTDALTVEDAMVVQIIDTDVAEVAMHPIRMHINIALVAGVMPFFISAW